MGDEDLFDPDPPADDIVALPIGPEIDLHAFAPRDQASVVAEYVAAAAAAGLREVRIVHGKGIGVQRDMVRRHLAASALVERFCDDPSPRGGKGATMAWLIGGREG